MKITVLQQNKTLNTVDIFGDMTPQPEITIQPVHQKQRQQFVRDATIMSLVRYPDKDGYQTVEQFDKWKFIELMALASVVELRNFEDENGVPMSAENGEILNLLRTLPAAFGLWLYDHILKLSDLHDFASEDARKNYLSGLARTASAKVKK